jgi:hypothetical protein
MDEQVIQDLFNRAVSKGYGKTLDEFKILLVNDNDVIEDNFEYVTSQGYTKSIDDFKVLIGAEKKKDSSDSPVISPKESTESPITPVQEEPTSPVSTSTEPTEITGVTPQESTQENQQDQIDEIIIEQQQINPDDIVELDPSRYGAPTDQEENTWLEEMVGDTFVVGEVADFFGDMYRAAERGLAQGATVDDAMGLLLSGGTMSDTDLQEYISAVGKMDSLAMSDEMKDFNKTYKENGSGLLGFVLGLGKNISIIPELLITSIFASLNPTVAAGAGAGAGTGAATGAALTSAGGPLAIFGAGAGAIGGTFAGASATLETGLAFTEFLKEVITEKGLEFDPSGIRTVLEDPDAIQKIRNKAAARGMTIGLVDGLTAGLAGKVGAQTTKAALKAGQTATKAGAKGAVTAAGIEAAGGSGGEALARGITGQEMDVAEIGLEGIVGQASSVVTVPTAITGKTPVELLTDKLKQGTNFFKPPVYTLNNTKMSKQELDTFLDTATLEEIRTMNIDVVNDPATSKRVTDLFSKAQYDKQLPDYVKGKDRDRLIDLEIEKQSIANTELESSKIRLQEIKNEIKTILDTSKEQPTEVAEPDAKTKEIAKDELISEGILEPTVEQINTRANAIQESSPKEVDVQEQPGDGQTVGERDTEGAVTEESQEAEAIVAESKEAQVTPLREKIDKPFSIPKSTMEVRLTPEGKVDKIYKKGTNTSVNKPSQAKAGKYILKNVIDVNEGQQATIPQDIKSEAEAGEIVAEQSQNVRQVAETIDFLKKKAKESKIDFSQDQSGIFAVLDLPKFSTQSIRQYFGMSPKQMGISNRWHTSKLDDKTRKPIGISIEDGWIDFIGEESGITVDDIADFITQYGTQAKINELKKGGDDIATAIVSLENKFKDLTGLAPTPTNIKTALSVDPTREPLKATEVRDVEQLTRESLDPEVADFGKKKGPSKEKIAGKKRTKVQVDEQAALKSQIRLEARAAREGAKEAKEQIIKEQRLKRKRKVAKKNIGKKLGVISQDLDTALQTLFSIDPNLIPNKQLEAYIELVNEFSERKAVLNLNDKAVTLEKALDIINAVEQEVQVDDEGGLTKTKDKEDKDFNEAEEVDAIVKDKFANLQISNIPDERSQQIAKDINDFTKEDVESLIIEKEDGTKDYKVLETLKAVKENIKNGFVPKAALDIVVNVKVAQAAKAVMPKMLNVKKAGLFRNIASALNVIKTSILRDSPSGTNLILDRIRSSPTFFVDDIYGNFNDKTIYNNTFRVMAEAYETYKSEVTKLQTKIDAADQILEYGGVNKLRKGLRVGKSQNAIVKQKYKIRLYQLQREHLSNIVDGKVNSKAPSGLSFLDATIDAIKNGDVLSEPDLRILEEIRNEFVTGDELNYQKLENSLTPAEKKALALYDEVNNSLADKAVFISSTLHGNRVNLLNNYTHHAILDSENTKASVLEQQKENFVSGSLATKAGTIIERTPGAKPISFDPSYSARRGAQQTLLDYEMTEANRVVAKTINKLSKDIKGDKTTTKAQRQAVNALVKSTNEINRVLFDKTFQDLSTADVLARRVMTLGYQAALGSVPRAAAELAANTGIMLKNPALSAKSIAKYSGLAISPGNASLGFDILSNLKSTETSKMYDTENLQSKYTNMSDFMTTSPGSGSAASRMSNVLGIAAKASGVKQLSSVVNNIANRLISFPDQALSRPLWFGTFADVFAKKTKELYGTEVNLSVADYKKIGDGTSPYLKPEFKEAREAATQAADANSIAMATSVNPYNVIIKNIPRKEDNARLKLYRLANSYMARFSLFEYSTARNAINSLFKNGNITRPEALGLLAGITYRMTAYMVVYTALTSELDDLLFDAEDDRDDDLEDLVARQTVGSVLSLLTRGTLGNIPVIPINYMLEQGINEPFLGDFRDNQEYDPYKHAIVFSQLSNQDLKEKDIGELMIKIFSGPYGPLIASIIRTGELGTRAVFNKTKESREKNIDELTNRMTVEALGNSGLVPFYKDVRRILLKKRFFEKPKLTAKELKELREKYPEYFSDVETSTTRSRPSRQDRKKRQSRPSR